MKFTLRLLSIFSFLFSFFSNDLLADSRIPTMPMIYEEIHIIKESLGDNAGHEMPVYEFNFKDILTRMVKKCPSTSPMLRACCEKLTTGCQTLPLCDLLEIMPEVIKFAYESYEPTPKDTQERAPRPSSENDNDAVVGKNTCDLTQVLALLSMIKKRIQILQDIVCRKFSETWTILADIKETITEEFFDTRTILCDKFNGTFTMLDEIEREIIDTRTILCDKFNGTFTVLNEIEIEIFDTLTILCDKFNGTFTELNQIEIEIIDTRTILCDKFNGTFTELNQIEIEIIDTRTILCDKFNGTFTVLACFQDIPVSTPTIITAPGSYCLINDIVGTITIAADCVTLNLNNFKLLGTEEHVTVGGNGIVVKNGSIQGSAGNGIAINDSTNVELVNLGLLGNFNGIFISTATCIKIEDCTFSGHTNRAIQATTLFNANFSNLIAKNNTAPVIIDLSDGHNVNFDHVFVNNNTSASNLTAILLNLSCNLCFNKVTANENIAAAAFFGIDLTGVQNAQFADCAVHKNIATDEFFGLSIANSQDITLKYCQINQNNSTTASVACFDGSNSFKIAISNSQANNNVAANSVDAFNFLQCSDVIHKECFALENSTTGAGDTTGFRSNVCIKSIYDSCIANDNIATNTAIGFALLNTDTSCILNCLAKRNTGTNTGRGIFLFDCFNCLVDSNNVIGNTGTSTGIGIEVSNTGGGGILTTAVVNNRSQAHDADYITVPGDIPRVGLIFSTGLFTAPPTPFDNLFTQAS